MRLTIAFCLLGSTIAFCDPISLTFDGLQDAEQVLSYYDGGLGGQGSGPGPSQGIWFSEGLAAQTRSVSFVPPPSARLTGSSVTMNFSEPQIDLISFYFAGSGVVTFYPGLNGAGPSIAEYPIMSFPFSEAPPGVYRSIVFTNTGDLQLDTVTLGGSVIPEPSSLLLVCSGLLCVSLVRRRRPLS